MPKPPAPSTDSSRYSSRLEPIGSALRKTRESAIGRSAPFRTRVPSAFRLSTSSLAFQRLLDRLQQGLGILGAGDADAAVEDEERHPADAGAARLHVGSLDRVPIVAAVEVSGGFMAVEPGARRHFGQRRRVGQVGALGEVGAEELLGDLVLAA